MPARSALFLLVLFDACSGKEPEPTESAETRDRSPAEAKTANPVHEATSAPGNRHDAGPAADRDDAGPAADRDDAGPPTPSSTWGRWELVIPAWSARCPQPPPPPPSDEPPRIEQPGVRIGGPRISKEVFRRVVHRYDSAFVECYEASSAAPSCTDATVGVHLIVEGEGFVHRVAGTSDVEGLAACTQSVFRTMRFPSLGGPSFELLRFSVHYRASPAP